MDSLDKQNRAYLREMRLLSLEFVKENVNNPAGQSLLMEIMGLPDRLLVDVVERANAETLRLPLMQQIVERVNIFKACLLYTSTGSVSRMPVISLSLLSAISMPKP